MRNNLCKPLDATTMAGTTQVFSNPIFVENVYAFAFQHIPTGTAAGSLQLQATNWEGRDEQGGEIPATAWSNIDAAITITSTVGMVSKADVAYRWVRFAYTPASGTGTFTVLFNSKGF